MGWNKPNMQANWPVVAVRLPMAERAALQRMAREWDCSQSYIMRYGIALAARAMGIELKPEMPNIIDDVGQVMFDFPVSSSMMDEDGNTA